MRAGSGRSAIWAQDRHRCSTETWAFSRLPCRLDAILDCRPCCHSHPQAKTTTPGCQRQPATIVTRNHRLDGAWVTDTGDIISIDTVPGTVYLLLLLVIIRREQSSFLDATGERPPRETLFGFFQGSLDVLLRQTCA